MKIDASLKRLFQRPPNLLLSQAFGEPIVVRRILSTESIVVENLHPDLLFELDNGNLIHAELHGYWMDGFACRNLIYFGLVLRDYKRPPQQVVFWVGQRNVGITDGLHYDPALHYQYRVVDVRDLDPEPLLASSNVNESIFAILCRVTDARETVIRILRQIFELPAGEQREALLQLLILSGVRSLNTVVEQEVKAMPFEIDIHENTFLEGIYQKAEQDRTRSLLLRGLELRFGPVSSEIRDRVLGADLTTLDRWYNNFVPATKLDDVFA